MFRAYTITVKENPFPDIFVLKVKPQQAIIPDFLPGQYVCIRNPRSKRPDEEKPFSIASSPLTKDYLEFCIRVYGEWTEELQRLQVGNELLLSEPMGNFVFDDHISNAVFLAGGIGISPIMSMLRFFSEISPTSPIPHFTLLYGNRTPETVMYKDEIEKIFSDHQKWHLVHIYSEVPETDPNKSYYTGFITGEILRHEVDFAQNPTFFLIGPPVFIEKMQEELQKFSVPEERIKTELLTVKSE